MADRGPVGDPEDPLAWLRRAIHTSATPGPEDGSVERILRDAHTRAITVEVEGTDGQSALDLSDEFHAAVHETHENYEPRGEGEPTERERIEQSVEALEESQQAARRGLDDDQFSNREENPLGGINHALAHLKIMQSHRDDG